MTRFRNASRFLSLLFLLLLPIAARGQTCGDLAGKWSVERSDGSQITLVLEHHNNCAFEIHMYLPGDKGTATTEAEGTFIQFVVKFVHSKQDEFRAQLTNDRNRLQVWIWRSEKWEEYATLLRQPN